MRITSEEQNSFRNTLQLLAPESIRVSSEKILEVPEPLRQFDVSSKHRVHGVVSVTPNQIQCYKMSGSRDLQIQLEAASFFPWMQQRLFLWDSERCENKCFSLAIVLLPFHSQELAYSQVCVWDFDFYLKKCRSEIVPTYQTMSIFSPLRLFSYSFARHIKPLPSTSALRLGLHAKA